MITTTTTPAIALAIELHNTSRWHFLHWINPVRAALDAGLPSDWILTTGTTIGPRGLDAAVTAAEVPA